jgi:hypothetical protein
MAEIRKGLDGRFKAVYVFNEQLALALPEEQAQREKPKELVQISVLTSELTARGVALGVAKKLVNTHAEEKIRLHLDIYDQDPALGEVKNKGGYLRQRIEQDWPAFEGYLTPEARKAVEETHRVAQQKKIAQRAKEDAERAARKREQARFDALPPEEKANEALERWLLVQRGFYKVEPSESERQAQYEELLTEYRKLSRKK